MAALTPAQSFELKLAVVNALEWLRPPFTEDMKFTFVARHPSNPECHIVVTDDDIEAVRRVLLPPDDGEPVTAEWLRSIHVFGGAEDGPLPANEFEVTIDAGNAVGRTEIYGDEPGERIYLGISLPDGLCYVEACDGHNKTLSLVELVTVTTRGEFRKLCRALRAWDAETYRERKAIESSRGGEGFAESAAALPATGTQDARPSNAYSPELAAACRVVVNEFDRPKFHFLVDEDTVAALATLRGFVAAGEGPLHGDDSEGGAD